MFNILTKVDKSVRAHTCNLLLSPKQIGTICFAIFSILISAPTFATGVSSTATSADCDKPTLNTYSGTSNLQADWQANTIALHWYDGDDELTVPTESQSCTYDGTLTPPTTIPTKTGYTFKGWRVRIPIYDFATIPTNVIGTNHWAIGWDNNANYCWYDTNTGTAWNVACDSDNTYSQELQTYEWKVKYSHGDLYGMSGCSTTDGTYATAGNPTIGSGQYCWCKATGYKATGSNEIKGPLSALSWVFRIAYGSVAYCARLCADRCANHAERNSAFLGALFAGSGN